MPCITSELRGLFNAKNIWQGLFFYFLNCKRKSIEMQGKYDSAFVGILQNEGDISKFMDSIFSFLYRKYAFTF